jgi:hypothetical protein
MTEQELETLCGEVNNRRTLAKYLRALSQDAKGNQSAWENYTASDYIESISAALDDMEYWDQFGAESEKKWKFVAELMTTGKTYE